jgi:hypothetical protein
VTNKQPDEQGSPETIQQQKDRENLAAVRLTPWDAIRENDYNFRWMKGEGKELLEAGCIYEYSRESSKLRGLLVMMNEFDGTATFESLREKDARRLLRGAVRWLRGYANELADNKSFADLLHKRGKEIRKTIRQHPLYLSLGPAIQLAYPFPFDFGPPPWPWQPWSWDSQLRIPVRPSYEGGSEKLAIEIRWRDFTNSQIARELKKFVARYRPENEKEPEPQTPEIRLRSYLKALSVMRIWKLQKGKQWKRLELVAKTCRYRGCVKEAEEYKRRCKQGHGDQPMSQAAKTEMSDARARALSFFQRFFPDEKPSNY